MPSPWSDLKAFSVDLRGVAAGYLWASVMPQNWALLEKPLHPFSCLRLTTSPSNSFRLDALFDLSEPRHGCSEALFHVTSIERPFGGRKAVDLRRLSACSRDGSHPDPGRGSSRLGMVQEGCQIPLWLIGSQIWKRVRAFSNDNAEPVI